MATAGDNSKSHIGFLTVVEDSRHGLFGGYLVLNRAGRPLEFHCTAPVRPNRAQEILYGPTLRPYLYGEQIGRTLLEQGKYAPVVVLTDCEPMLAVGELISMPVALVGNAPPEREPGRERCPGEPNGRTWRVDSAETADPHLRFFEVGAQKLAVGNNTEPATETTVVQRIGAVAATLDLSEPFQRIRAAIDEARRGGQ
jgi:hypothetical protein